MKILDKYVIRNYILPLVYCLFLFIFLYVVADVFANLEDILRNRVSIPILSQYYGSFIPAIFVQTLPIASLLAVVYMLSIFNRNNELTAVKACGISIRQLLLPVFIISVMLGLLNFLMNETIVPDGSVRAERIKSEYIKSNPGPSKKMSTVKDMTYYGKKNQLVYAQELNIEDNKMSGIIIIERDDNLRIRRKILSAKALWRDGTWIFYDCVIYRFDALGKSAGSPLVFAQKVIDFAESPEQLHKFEFRAGCMNYRELKNHIARISGPNSKVLNSMKTDLYFKTAMPFVPVIIMLLGIPFAMSTTRGGAMSGIGISIFIGLFFYGSIYISLAVGKGGLLPPLVAAHLPNILFTLIAIRLLRR
ncbi:MAG: LptF/LptG family permease [Candidatus Omnitrophota bacterium]|jgi:lipopolysaccharide export system permease protein